MWELPIELKRRMPHIPMICDPSHICGSTDLLLNVAQTAMDLDYQGLMIETHCDPPSALSDAKQQVTPEELGNLLKKIIIRKSSIEDKKFINTLEDLRDKIDEMDNNLITVLGNRMEIARAIGVCKKQNRVTIFQNTRWNKIVKNRTKQGIEKQLTPDFMIKLFEIIHQESIHHQKLVMHEPMIEKEK